MIPINNYLVVGIIFNRIMKVPKVEVRNLSLAPSCIQQHLPEGLICEEVTISMDLRKNSWSALCIATDAFPEPKDVKNCISIKRRLQISFGRHGVVRRVQISIHNQPNGDVSYKWHLLINPPRRKSKASNTNVNNTLKFHFESAFKAYENT
ncbi:uncharacterized protein LOC122577591 [Bombus pyrosoma]|uniref:uncharacterized protein LOC122577591 n=1 Tax=Bombus pyrosoma TaxID=396416 RepID=UPI001CB8FC6B|nr:uncharacterized protein LOC122577591 [Bombus pyrosoma]